MGKIIILNEIEWWDRVAMAVDMLLKSPEGRGQPVRAGGVSAYVFKVVADPEVLRRLSQMPDETPLDLLMEPLAVYCPEMNSFVSVNDPLTSMEEHLARLQKAG